MTDLRSVLAHRLGRAQGPRISFYPAPPIAEISFRRSFGQDGAGEILGSIGDAWSDATAALSRWLFADAGAGAQIAVPQEASDPAAARRYLVDAMTQLASAHQWPGDGVVSRLQAMAAVPTQPTVVATVKALRVHGPDMAWPSGVEWYELADKVTGAASMLDTARAAQAAASPTAATTAAKPAAPRPPPAPVRTSTSLPSSAPSSGAPSTWAPPEGEEGWSWRRAGLWAAGGLVLVGAAVALGGRR